MWHHKILILKDLRKEQDYVLVTHYCQIYKIYKNFFRIYYLMENTTLNVSNITAVIFGTFSLCKKLFSGVILSALFWAILYL
jgi:hypothetical protein